MTIFSRAEAIAEQLSQLFVPSNRGRITGQLLCKAEHAWSRQPTRFSTAVYKMIPSQPCNRRLQSFRLRSLI